MAKMQALKSAEIGTAIYLDFEGPGRSPGADSAPPPWFVGILDPLDAEQDPRIVVFDPVLQIAGNATGCERGNLRQTLLELIERAELGDRVLVAWSTRELEVARTTLGTKDFERFAARYRNAISLCRRWARVCHPEWKFRSGTRGNGSRLRKNALSNYAEALGLRWDSGSGPGITAGQIRYAREQLAKKGTFEAMTAVSKGKWTKALKHNRLDLEIMRKVCVAASGELER